MFDKTSRDRSASFERKRKALLRREPLCRECKERIAEEVDHIIPLFKGGSNDLDNLQPMCKQCHNRKSLIERGKMPEVKVDKDGKPIGISNLDLQMMKARGEL